MFSDNPLPLIFWLFQTDQHVQKAKLAADLEAVFRQAAPAAAEALVASAQWTLTALVFMTLAATLIALALGFLFRRIAMRRWVD